MKFLLIVFLFLFISSSNFSYSCEPQAKEKKHPSVSYPFLLHHSTNSDILFELIANGTPRGPAFFTTKPTGMCYIDLYHKEEDSYLGSRELVYQIKGKPNIVAVNKLEDEIDWVQKKLGFVLPTVFSGRGSIIDRYPSHKKEIIKAYMNERYDGILDERNNTLVVFEPDKYLKLAAVKPLSKLIDSDKKIYFYDIFLKFIVIVRSKNLSLDSPSFIKNLKESPFHALIQHNIYLKLMFFTELEKLKWIEKVDNEENLILLRYFRGYI